MKKIFSKKYLTTLISSFTVGTGIILACAGGDWDDEYGTSNFAPEAFVDSSYRPFFYSGYNFYYGIGYDMQHDSRFNGSNVDDWSLYLGKEAPATEVEFLLKTASASSIDSANRFLAGKVKTLPAALQAFRLFKNASKQTTAFINYLSLAKACEDFATNNFEYAWDYDSKKSKTLTVNTKQVNEVLGKEYNQTKDPFLKQRYWFQLVRSYFYNEPPQTAIDFFERNQQSFPKNELYYRTIAYTAGAYYKLKNYSKANYYYSKVYDGCNALKTVAHYSFHPQEENDWKATLALCANNEEKITLWQMLGVFYSDETRAMKEIYALNPRSEKLNLLLTRAINKEEVRFSGWEPYMGDSKFSIKKDTLKSDLYTLSTRIAQAGNTSEPWMWYMAAGYLDMLTGNTQKAAASYKLAEKKLPKEQLAQAQLRLLKLINTIAGTPKADSKFEKQVLTDLEWITNGTFPPDFRRNTALSWIRETLSKRYKAQKELIKAVCFRDYNEFYASNNNVEAMKSFLNKADKTPYELYYAKLYALTTYDLLEYQAVNLAMEDKLEEAIKKLEGIPAAEHVLPGNPFNGRLQDCHDCDHEAAQKIKYTKLSLLKKMKDMEDKIKTGTEAYSNAMLVANAFYNITHYGNARAFYEGRILGEFHYSPFSIDSLFRGMLTDMKMATKYYTLALAAAKTDEQKAKCHFMLAKCERNQWYNQTFYNNSSNEYGDLQGQAFLPWNGFKSLKQYSNTQFYKEAIKECGYFKSFTEK
ncbi:hypothetical protein A3860_15310 [Niastella vici]|uniref:Uncharacterized protein n=1 Tax=Niastella vici TaxID=1703345 RepID=A0A1V9G661_9BACT|nr:hypothetical protein [Niastella vici]OQP65956.1 hypothetical protein A3860_15310 [Niastella vici]